MHTGFSAEAKLHRPQSHLIHTGDTPANRSAGPGHFSAVPRECSFRRPEAMKKEIELLRGKWSLNGEVQLAIYGDESFEINIGGAHINGARKIDPTKKPKEIT